MNLLARVLAWLKEGYPQGIPEQDYVPLLALLRRRLSDQEVDVLAQRLEREVIRPISRIDVGTSIMKITDELPDDVEIERVSKKLHRMGLELSDFLEGNSG